MQCIIIKTVQLKQCDETKNPALDSQTVKALKTQVEQ